MKSVGKLILLSVSLIVFSIFTQIGLAQYTSWQPSSDWTWSYWFWQPQQWQWIWPPSQWTNQPNPLLIFPGGAWSAPYRVNTAKCFTNLTVPIEKATVDAGSKINIYGRIWPSAIGYQIVNPQASIYFDGNLVGSAQGDWNGNYRFSFPVPAFLNSGTHWVTVNASIDGCEPGILTERVNIVGPVQVPYPYFYNLNIASIWLNVTDCSSGLGIPSWAVLGNGLYAQSALNGKILFSNIQPGTYNYWAYSGGYTTGQGSVSVGGGTTATSSICLNKAAPLPSPSPTISVAVPADDPPWKSSSSYAKSSVAASGASEVVWIILALVVLACLIAVGIGINHFGRKNLMRIPEEM